MSDSATPARLRLPDVLTGDFTGVIIGTFGASLDFAESQLFRQLSKHTVNRLILADDVQLDVFLASQPAVRRLNRSYVASPVRSPRAHHPKFILLAGPSAGRLLVGSGNLSISGYTGPGECFTVYEWDPSDPESAHPFTAVRDLLELQIGRGWIDKFAQDRIGDLLGAAPWIPTRVLVTGPVVHNQRTSLLDQLERAVGSRKVSEIVACAPFHDKRSSAISELLNRLSPEKFCLLVQDRLTRLDKATLSRELTRAGVEVAIKLATAPAPYPNVLLHAKFILVRTETGDVLLQGSANLSHVALCRSGAEANVEIGNLLEGEPGSFDYLFDALVLSELTDGLTSFKPDEDWGSDDDDEHVKAGPWGVCWNPPRLTGSFTRSTQEPLAVKVAGASIEISHQHWDETDNGWHFTLEFESDESGHIDRARSVELLASDRSVWSVYPYHLIPLLRLSASGHRAHLLQDVGDLDLRDKELEELVAELERVLVVDGRSLWRLAHPDEVPVVAEDEASRVAYTDLDWERIGVLPQLRQYGLVAKSYLLAQTELGIVLQALMSRFRAEVRSGGGGANDDVSDTEDLSNEQESEGADQLDDASEAEAEDELNHGNSRTPSQRTRVRRLWKNFVRRFVSGLADDEFVASVGSVVIIPSYIVFNHLCRRLRVVELIDAEYLTEAQLKLWAFMWGEGSKGGYLATLQGDERNVARSLLSEYEDVAVTLAAVVDVWRQLSQDDAYFRPLRDSWRQFLVSDDLAIQEGVLSRAAAVALACKGDDGRLLDDLYNLATKTDVSELELGIAECVGSQFAGLEEKCGRVRRGGESGHDENCPYFEISGVSLTLDLAEEILAVWKSFEPRRRYFRIESSNAVAVLDVDFGDRFFYLKESDEELTLQVIPRPKSRWEERLEQLVDTA